MSRARAWSEEIRQRGFALLIVLWSLVLLSLILTQVLAAARSETRLAGNLRDAAAVQTAADGAAWEAAFHVLDSSDAHWQPDGRVHRIATAAGPAEAVVRSETGLVNPNLASAELLTALLHDTGTSDDVAGPIANAIVAWRTPVSGGRTGPDSAYAQAGLPYSPPGRLFTSATAVGEVLGVTPAILARLLPHLSVYNPDDPDPEFADPVVKQALTEVAGGQAPAAARPDVGPDESVVSVTVRLTGRGGAFTRHAVFSLGGGDGPPMRVLLWQ